PSVKHLRLSEIMSSPRIKNISVFTNPKSELYPIQPVPFRGAYHDRHETWEGTRWTLVVPKTNGYESVRQRRVVLTPDMLASSSGETSFSGATVARELRLTGESAL